VSRVLYFSNLVVSLYPCPCHVHTIFVSGQHRLRILTSKNK